MEQFLKQQDLKKKKKEHTKMQFQMNGTSERPSQSTEKLFNCFLIIAT